MRAYVNRHHAMMRDEVFLIGEDSDGRFALSSEQYTKKYFEPGRPSAPFFSLDMDDMEAIFQAMWDAGFRPRNGSSGKAEVDAQAKHIAFAEKVADKLLAKVTS